MLRLYSDAGGAFCPSPTPGQLVPKVLFLSRANASFLESQRAQANHPRPRLLILETEAHYRVGPGPTIFLPSRQILVPPPWPAQAPTHDTTLLGSRFPFSSPGPPSAQRPLNGCAPQNRSLDQKKKPTSKEHLKEQHNSPFLCGGCHNSCSHFSGPSGWWPLPTLHLMWDC